MPDSKEHPAQYEKDGFPDIFETAPFAIYEIDYKTPQFLRVNQIACKLSGYTKQEFLSMNPYNLLDLESAQRFSDRIRRGLAGEEIDESVEFKLKAKDGHDIWARLSVKPTYKNGTLESALVVGYDITGSKKAEKEKNQILESITDGFVAIDKQWRYSYINSAGAMALRKNREELIGQSIWDVWSNAPRKFREELERSVKQQVPVHFEVHYPEHFNLWYGCHCYPTKDGLTVFFSDITERKIAEEKLKQSEEQARQRAEELQKLMDIIPAAIWVSNDPECRVIVGNQTANYFYEAVEGENVSAGLASGKEKNTNRRFFKNGKELLPQELPMQEAAFKNKEIRNSELEVLSPTQKMTILGSAKPLLTSAGKVRGCLAAFIDISERKKVEEALKESEAKFKTLAENAPDPIMRFDKNLRITYLNPADLAVTGATLEEVIGKTNEELGMPAELCSLWNNMFERAKTTRQPQQVEFDFNSNMETKTFSLRIMPEFALDGSLISYMGISRDITDLKRVEGALKERTEQLEQTQKRLEEKATEVEEYASQMEQLAEQRAKQLKDAERLAAIGATANMVGHDIRNPLQAITSDIFLAKSELLSLADSNEKKYAIESLDEIQKNVDYINKIVADLQDYSRVLKPEKVNVNLLELMSTIILPIKMSYNIDYRVDIEHSFVFKSDPTLLRRILTNLITNGIQAMPDGGTLTISGRSRENNVVLIVEDTGVGISDEVKTKLFTPMLTTKSKGQGLGLAVAKRLVEALDGTISFESKIGKGTRFIIELATNNARRD